MFCMKCNKELEECQCPDLAERMRELSDEGGFMAARWCAKCDNHYARCYCAEPEWMVRMDGKLQPFPPDRLRDAVPKRVFKRKVL